MTGFFKRIFNFIKNYPGILYSLFLIILIPAVLYFNTFFAINSFQKNIDYNLQTQALIAESIFGSLANEFFSQPEILQKKIEEIAQENKEIAKLRITQEEKGGKFKIVAAQNTEEIGNLISDPFLSLSWAQNQAIADLINEQGERFWKVTRPIYDSKTGEKIGLISMALSLKDSDASITRSVYLAYLVIIVAIIACLFLIIQHTLLFSFVALTNKLQELDKMKDEFIRMATHELQTPIANIHGYISTLEEETSYLLDDAQKEYLNRIKISARNLGDLIYDILEVSRIEQGRLDFTAQTISPNQLIKESVGDFQIKAEQKNLRLIFTETPTSRSIFVNPTRFKQIVTNLIENAIKYTTAGEIEIGAKADEAKRKYIVFIRDTGLGMPAEAQKRLFERFYRVKTKETAGIPGTGLGLWISKQLCEKMGGEILVESMEGIGSKFTLSFPLAK